LIDHNFLIKHFGPLSLQCTLRLPKVIEACRLIIVAPGFLTFKDWGFLPYLSQRLCQAGFAALSFSHALSGIRENPLEITDLVGFSKNSTTQELRDWDLLLDTVLTGRLPYSDTIKLNAFGIVGHSRGGSYGILMAARVAQIQSVVTWGAIHDFHRYDAETQRRWLETGSLEIQRKGRDRTLRLEAAALEALERNRERLDILRAMRSVNIPILLLHGREDRHVLLSEAHKLFQCSNPHLSRLHVVESAGHTFRTQHPFTVPSAPLLEAVAETVRWFDQTLPK
jgi:pimeloyl-ACP methyl ester carboxylesterase